MLPKNGYKKNLISSDFDTDEILKTFKIAWTIYSANQKNQ
jgi:hypothetical protein